MLDSTSSQSQVATTAVAPFVTRRLTRDDSAAILSLQDAVIESLQPAERHFLKRRDATYLERLLTHGIGVGCFDTGSGALVSQALLRRQTFANSETNCNVNNFLRHAEERHPKIASRILPELQQIGWGVIGILLVSPSEAYLRRGLARNVIGAMIADYHREGGKHLFASTALDNAASQKVFAAHGFEQLAAAVDPKDGWRCVILHHPPRHED